VNSANPEEVTDMAKVLALFTTKGVSSTRNSIVLEGL